MCGNVDLELPTEADPAKRPERRNQDYKQPRRTNHPDPRDPDERRDRDQDRDRDQPRERTFSQRRRRSASRNRPANREEVYYQKKGEDPETRPAPAAERRAPSRGKRQPGGPYAKRDFREDRYAERPGRTSDRYRRRSHSRDERTPADSDYRPKRLAGAGSDPKPRSEFQEKRRDEEARPRRADRPAEAPQPEERQRRAPRAAEAGNKRPPRDGHGPRDTAAQGVRDRPQRVQYRAEEPKFVDSDFPQLT